VGLVWHGTGLPVVVVDADLSDVVLVVGMMVAGIDIVVDEMLRMMRQRRRMVAMRILDRRLFGVVRMWIDRMVMKSHSCCCCCHNRRKIVVLVAVLVVVLVVVLAAVVAAVSSWSKSQPWFRRKGPLRNQTLQDDRKSN